MSPFGLNRCSKSSKFLALLLIALSFFSYYSLVKQPPYFVAIDIGQWGLDSERLKNCLSVDSFPCVDMTRVPLGYLINSFILIYLGVNTGIDDRLILAAINLAFLIVPVILYLLMDCKKYYDNIFVYLILIFLTPIIPFYIYTGGLEIQSGVMLGILSFSLVRILSDVNVRIHKLDYLVLILSSLCVLIYKDTNFILITSIIFLIILFKLLKKRNINILTIFSLIFSLMLGFILSSAFNYIKKGSIFPVEYMAYASVFPDPYRSFKYFMATIFSPNGGILFFWGASFVFVYVMYKLKIILINNISLVISGYIILFFIIGHAFWSGGGFGWYSWGSRYMVPPFLASVICIIFSGNVGVSKINLAHKKRLGKYQLIAMIIIVIVTLLSLRYIYISFVSNKAQVFAYSLDGKEKCIKMTKFFLLPENKNIALSDWYNSIDYINCENERFTNFLRIQR